MNLSEHFTLEEFSFSAAAVRLGIDNTPAPAIVTNLSLVAAVMEHIRTALGARPIVMHSGYRSAKANQAVGGVETSAHCQGLACDFVCPDFGTPAEVAVAILKSDVQFDQLILECTLACRRRDSPPRGEALTKRSQGTAYEPGIRA
jgi:zinc D-Ala-D-Ala carboxypeptidase